MSPSTASVLIVDDDGLVRELIATYLEAEGFSVRHAEDGVALDRELAAAKPDVVLLDLALPGEDGLTVLRRTRHLLDAAIIIMSSRTDVIDRVAGLEAGADDYLSKPVHPRELLARVRTVLRRMHPAPREPAPAGDTSFSFHGYTLYQQSRRLVGKDGGSIELTSGEFDLLSVFITHAGMPLERDRLLDLTSGPGWASFDRSIDQRVRRLRTKIEPDPNVPTMIKSVRGVGYLFAGPVTRG